MDYDTIEKRDDTMVGFPPKSVSGVITVCDGAWYSRDLGGFEFGCVKINT